MASSGELTNVRFTETSTTPLFKVGIKTTDTEGGVWQYVKAASAVALGAYVKISSDGLFTIAEGTTTLLPSTEPSLVGCAQVAFADNEFGWVCRSGSHLGKFAASCVQNVKIYTTATAGVVDDTATTQILGLKLITTIVGAATVPAFATCEMVTGY